MLFDKYIKFFLIFAMKFQENFYRTLAMRLIPLTSLTIRRETRSSTSYRIQIQSAVIKSEVIMGAFYRYTELGPPMKIMTKRFIVQLFSNDVV